MGGGPSKKPAVPPPSEELDIISEADLFLSYGRDEQAESLLKQALEENASNVTAQLKLLSIYANRKDKNGFSSIARKVEASGDAAAWAQAAALGRSIDPANPMYGSAGEAPAPVPEEASHEAMPLDMDIGFNIPMDLDITSAAQPISGAQTDFDISGSNAGAAQLDVTGGHNVTGSLLPDFDVTGGHQAVTTEHNMDFDVTGSHEPAVAGGGMDFDVTGGHAPLESGLGMDFDVTGGHAPLESGLGMDFDVTGGGAAPAAVASPAVSMDFDISAGPGTAAPAAEASGGGMDFDISAGPGTVAPAAETSGGGMDFDISAGPATAASGGMDFNSSLVTGEPLDLDISGGTATTAGSAPSAEEAGGGGLDLGLDFNVSGSAAAETPFEAATSTTVLDSASLDLDITGGSSAAPAGSEAAPSTEGGLDLGLDFDVSSSGAHPPAVEAQPGEAMSTVVLDSGAMDFDLGGSSSADALAETMPGAGATAEQQVQEFKDEVETSVVLTPGEDFSALSSMDFDISATPASAAPATPDFDISAGPSEAPIDLGGVDFDVSTGSHARFSEETPSAVETPPEEIDTVVLNEPPSFDISAPMPDAQQAGYAGIGMGDTVVSPMAEAHKAENWEEVATKLELANAYMEMDRDNARELLEEVMKEGDAQQVEAAREMMQRL